MTVGLCCPDHRPARHGVSVGVAAPVVELHCHEVASVREIASSSNVVNAKLVSACCPKL